MPLYVTTPQLATRNTIDSYYFQYSEVIYVLTMIISPKQSRDSCIRNFIVNSTGNNFVSEDGPTNFWRYAAIAAGTAFIVFVAVALYSVWQVSQRW